jgi:triacylglycerol esterase/lipase EstA (alpha/beta hydrolase family)
MSGLKIRPTLTSFFTLFTTASFAVFLFALPAQAAEGEAYLIVPDMVLGNVEGTEEVFSSLYTELEKQGVPAENISNFRYDPYDGITTITEELDAELDRLTLETGDTEISVLGYGVGGLIVRNYLETELYTDNIESLIFAATPHEGTIAYTEHIYGKNISYLNAWERLYWEGKDVPMLMKQVLPTNLPLVGVSLEDEALTPLREAVAYSIIEDLKNREQDAESPIKNLTVTNLRPSGYFDGWYFTPKQIRTPYSTTNIRYRQISLASGVILEMERGIGDGYVTKSGARFSIGTTRDYWAKHEEIIHQGIRDVISGLGLSTGNLDTYHKQGIYDRGNFAYPKSYHSVAFKTDVSKDLELISLDTSAIPNVQRLEEEGRVILFGTELIQGQVEANIDSHSRQDFYLTTFLATSQEQIHYKVESFRSEVGERFRFDYNLKPYTLSYPWQLLSNDSYPYNVWQETSREWIQYPIILVHGILGSFNQRMLLDDDANLGIDLLDAITPKNWDVAFDIYRQEKWINLPTDNNWNYLRLSLEESGFEENEEYYRFFYDWRQPVTRSGVDLYRYIDFVKERTGSKKVNIVAHSMGGLVTRSYIENMGGVTYENDIARFVMVGTPNQGSVDSIPMWYGGDIVAGKGLGGIPFAGGQAWYLAVLDNINPFTNNPQGIRESIRTFIPSTRDLLPTWGDAFVTTRYQNAFDGGYVERFNPMDNETLIELNKRSNDDTSNLRDIEVTAIAGTGLDTRQAVFFQEENPFTDFINLSRPFSSWYIQHDGERQYFNGFDQVPSGDGTVIDDSLFGINGIGIETSVNVDETYSHRYILRNGEVLKNIFSSLNISNSIIIDNIPFDPNLGEQEEDNPFTEDSETLSILEFSPASIEVVTPSGRVLNESKTNEEFKEARASYISLGETDKKFYLFFEPEQGEYTINLTGTGEGEYTVTTLYESEEQFIFDDVTEATTPGNEDSYTFNLTKDDAGKVIEEAISLTPSNTPPTASLDNDIYEGVEGSQITFDGSSSTDEDGDTLQYRWAVTDSEGNEIISTEFSENSSYVYTFEDPFTGTVTLTVTDGEFESSASSEIIIRELSYSYEEKVSQIRELIQTLEENTSYMRSKKRLWIQLVDLLELAQVEKSDRLQSIVARILEKDIGSSLLIDNQLERTWMWWKRMDIISDSNELILEIVQNKLKEI